MGRHILTILLSLVLISKVNAQGKEIDKLIFMYIDEKYEKCVNKGISLTESDDYRKEPLPYLYVSMSYYEIAGMDELQEKYPNAFKDAMKYAYKYRKKDKNLEYAGKYKEYFKTLKDSANNLAQIYYKTENYRKAAYTYKQIVRFDPDAYMMQLWQGICEIKSRNIGEGERNIGLAMENIDDKFLPDEVELPVASAVFTEYSEYMDSKGDYAETRKGKQLAEKFKDSDPEVIRKQREAEAEKNKPVKEVKKFVTDEDEEKNQKTKFVGSNEPTVEDAKNEIEKIKQEQQQESTDQKKFKTFSSDDEDEDDDEYEDEDEDDDE